MKFVATSKYFTIYVLVNSSIIGVFINKNFMKKHCLNIFKTMLVYNIDRTTNKISQISEVVNIVFYYKTHNEWTLLIVFSISKQDLILGFTQLKQHNPEMDQQKKVSMTYYPTYCPKCQDTKKTDVRNPQSGLNIIYFYDFFLISLFFYSLVFLFFFRLN